MLIFSLASSLTATLEYVEEKTNVDSVFVNFQSNHKDRGVSLFPLALQHPVPTSLAKEIKAHSIIIFSPIPTG